MRILNPLYGNACVNVSQVVRGGSGYSAVYPIAHNRVAVETISPAIVLAPPAPAAPAHAAAAIVCGRHGPVADQDLVGLGFLEAVADGQRRGDGLDVDGVEGLRRQAAGCDGVRRSRGRITSQVVFDHLVLQPLEHLARPGPRRPSSRSSWRCWRRW